ncbi:MAG TPA: hypothetical protein VGW75_11420 [Solirubrobacteraceae bacterium]|nr:hypothetical protein [Solirubrobacteraceae bacterium]
MYPHLHHAVALARLADMREAAERRRGAGGPAPAAPPRCRRRRRVRRALTRRAVRAAG